MYKKLDTVLAETLLAKKLIARKELEALLKEVEETEQSLRQVLIKHGLLREQDILKAFAQALKLEVVNLGQVLPDKAVLDKVPVKIASYYEFIPLSIKERVLTIAVSWPLDIQTQDEIRTQLGFDIAIVLCAQDEILEALKKLYGLAADTLQSIASGISQDAPAELSEKIEDIEKLAADASVIKLVNQIILDAYRKRATDIHIEPYRQGVQFRYRVDGVLYDANVPAQMLNFLNAIISRIKIMSNLNIVERRLPQDGRAVVRVQEQVLDLRISTIPTQFGESVVVRILPTKMLFSLEKLGLSKMYVQVFEKLIQKPHGIIFVTGPTGSGKTTTLYACLSRINTKDRKIITIEDPIEYEMQGITQIQVMPEIGLDFATGLRHILRHDPDVIMVGEVRDLETAEIAIRVALTGHLVFSTLHTNDAPSGITRLVDIGLEPYLVASSIEAFIAQRLIRLNCENCKQEDKTVPLGLKKMIAQDMGFKAEEEVKIFRGKGCPTCNFTGFFNRTAIYEIFVIDDEMKELILKKTSSSHIKKLAKAQGMRTLRQDGWQKVILGLTTPEEVIKVTTSEELTAQDPETTFFTQSIGQELVREVDTDRRVYSRLSSKVNISYRLVKSEEELERRGISPEQLSVTKDISAGGLQFISHEKVLVGSIIELKVELPDAVHEHLECLARVVRVEEVEHERTYYISVCFLDITGTQRARLNKFVDTELK